MQRLQSGSTALSQPCAGSTPHALHMLCQYSCQLHGQNTQKEQAIEEATYQGLSRGSAIYIVEQCFKTLRGAIPSKSFNTIANSAHLFEECLKW